MKPSKVNLIALLLAGVGLAGVQAQQAIPTTGGNVSGNGGTVSYTVGQTVYTTNEGTNGSAFQGVQLPFEISVVVGSDVKLITLKYSLSPNPVSNLLTLEVGDLSNRNISYQLFNSDGKLIATQKLIRSNSSINMSLLAPAIYYLKIIDSNSEVKTFKILKK